jgi:hypothetical protein
MLLESQIIDVKRFIAVSHPHHPSPENQRLIYGGRILEDDLWLKDVIKRVRMVRVYSIVSCVTDEKAFPL